VIESAGTLNIDEHTTWKHILDGRGLTNIKPIATSFADALATIAKIKPDPAAETTITNCLYTLSGTAVPAPGAAAVFSVNIAPPSATLNADSTWPTEQIVITDNKHRKEITLALGGSGKCMHAEIISIKPIVAP
jgi:hypothetical protein